MLLTVDAFQQAVEEARRQLSLLEGGDVSIGELIQRTNLPQTRRSAVYYHLNPKVARKRGHNIPPDIVRALSDVLLVSEEHLQQAARRAAGHNEFGPLPGENPDVVQGVARALSDPTLDQRTWDEMADRILEVLVAERRKRRQSGGD